MIAAFLCSCSLYLRTLVLLLHLWQLCVQMLHLHYSGCGGLFRAHQQLQFRKMWFCHHHWCWGTQRLLVPPSLMLRDTKVIGLTTVPQQLPQSQVPFQADANYAIGPPHVSVSFRVEYLTTFLYMFVSVMVYAFSFQVPMWVPFSHHGVQPLGFALPQPFRPYLWQAYVHSGDGLRPTSGMHWVAAPSTALNRGSHILLSQLSCSHSNSMMGHAAFGTQQSHPIPLPSLHNREWFSFKIWFHPVAWLTLNLWLVLILVILVCWLGIRLMSLLTPGLQSGLLFIHTFTLGFTGKVSSLNHFPLKPGCEDYSFLDQVVANFEQGLDSILTDSIKTP